MSAKKINPADLSPDKSYGAVKSIQKIQLIPV